MQRMRQKVFDPPASRSKGSDTHCLFAHSTQVPGSNVICVLLPCQSWRPFGARHESVAQAGEKNQAKSAGGCEEEGKTEAGYKTQVAESSSRQQSAEDCTTVRLMLKLYRTAPPPPPGSVRAWVVLPCSQHARPPGTAFQRAGAKRKPQRATMSSCASCTMRMLRSDGTPALMSSAAALRHYSHRRSCPKTKVRYPHLRLRGAA